MRKSLVFTCSTVAVLLAASLPPAGAAAANEPAITYPTGTLLSVSPEQPKLQGTALGLPGITLGGTLMYQCTNFKTTGSLEKNNGSTFEVTISSATFTSCHDGLGRGLEVRTEVGNGVPWCLRSTPLMAEDEFQIRGNGCNKEPRAITMVLGCNFERSAPISGTFTTDTAGQDAILTLSSVEFTKEPNQPFCPSATSIDLAFTLELDTTSTADPIYIS